MSIKQHYSTAGGTRVLDNEDKFQMGCDLVYEFLYLRQRLPQYKGTALNERFAYSFISQQRNKMKSKDLSIHRIKMLNEVHRCILDKNAYPFYMVIKPSNKWTALFDKWALGTSKEVIDNFTFPTITDPYVATARSFQEHIVLKTECFRLFEPEDCRPGYATFGSLQHIIGFLIYPEKYDQSLPNNPFPNNLVIPDKPPEFVYEDNVFDNTDYPPPPHAELRHVYSGTFCPPSHTPSNIKELIRLAYNELFPTGDFLAELKTCKTVLQYDRILNKYESCLDTFNYANNGIAGGDIENIIGLLQFPQPWRIGLSVSFGRPRYFPLLGVMCQQLTAYGAAGRPQLDGRSRQIGPRCYNLGIAVWNYIRPLLTPISQQCPFTNCQVLIYPDIWLSDPDGILKARKEDRDNRNKQLKKKREKMKKEKKGSKQKRPPEQEIMQDNGYGTRSKKRHPASVNGYGTRSKKRQPSNSTIQSNVKSKTKTTTQTASVEPKLVHIKAEMRPHHDNGTRDISTGKHTGANPDKEVNSHIYGTDVLLVTSCADGDGMDYHLIRASHKKDPETGEKQDYTMSQMSTVHNLRRHKNNPKLNLVKTVKLDNNSLYIHTAHDDEIYSHALEYAEEIAKRNRVRLVFVYRMLAVSSHFRQSADDLRGNRYSLLSKHAIEKCMDRDLDAHEWLKALEYLDNEGNCILQHYIN